MRIVILDLIRLFASLSVVIYHYAAKLPSNSYALTKGIACFGYIGVPIFFTISGYVISISAYNRSATKFCISRFTRIYPIFWICLFFTIAITYLFANEQYSTRQILSNLTLLNEYLGQESIDGVYWTIKQELKFYACIFILLFFNQFSNYKIWLSIWLSMTITFMLFKQPFFMGYFITPHYSSFFIAGVSLFLIAKDKPNKFNVFMLTAAIIISSIKCFEQTSGFIQSPSLNDKFISVIILLAFFTFMYLVATNRIQLKERSIYIELGALTYPLYLIHNAAGKAIIDKYINSYPDLPLIISVIFLMLLSSSIINLLGDRYFALPLKKYLYALATKQSCTMAKSCNPTELP